ncbi:MAG: hypothetical protein EAZ95_06800 [Bacteroidetes bacterium]|nr:MAG: hypothetical protein EAZ95_06800 [Bacteroidota bacterium]
MKGEKVEGLSFFLLYGYMVGCYMVIWLYGCMVIWLFVVWVVVLRYAYFVRKTLGIAKKL